MIAKSWFLPPLKCKKAPDYILKSNLVGPSKFSRAPAHSLGRLSLMPRFGDAKFPLLASSQ